MFQEVKQEINQRLTLSDFLIKPIQRITKYQLLLKVRSLGDRVRAGEGSPQAGAEGVGLGIISVTCPSGLERGWPSVLCLNSLHSSCFCPELLVFRVLFCSFFCCFFFLCFALFCFPLIYLMATPHSPFHSSFGELSQGPYLCTCGSQPS